MPVDILSLTLYRLINELRGVKNISIPINPDLENTLKNYLIKTLTYKNSYLDNMKEVEISLENIILNKENYNGDLVSIINAYTNDYVNLIRSHPLTKIFIESFNEICSDNFNIKNVTINNLSKDINIAIRHIGKRLDIFHIPRIGEDVLPTMVIDDTLCNFKKPVYVDNFFADDLYVMSKRSELWYETPYYLSFMLKERRLEVPNVRLGISEENGKKVANIIATQTSQLMNTNQDYNILADEIKRLLPNDKHFRFINPAHVPALILTIGLLKGLGINEIVVKDYLPVRYKKVIIDKQLSEEEAENYQIRLTNKNMITIMYIVSNMDGIEISSYPESIYEMCLKVSDNVICKNDFLNKLYNAGLELGKKNKSTYSLKK